MAAGGRDGEADDAADAPDAPHPAFAPYAAESVSQAAVGSPGKDGVLELSFAPADGGTRLVRDYATVPFHVAGTLDHDPHPAASTVFVQSPTGGVAQGDRLDVTVDVAADAVAHVSTQSATKVQSMTANYAASEVALSVGADAHLDYVPEPTILHEGSRYHQDLTVDLAAGATAVVTEVVVPGRLARGERFDFERYAASVRADGPDGLLVEDAVHLAAGDADPATPGVLGEFAVLGTAYVIAPDRDAGDLSDALHDAATAAAPVEGAAGAGTAAASDDAVATGATALPNGAGAVVRGLGHRAETVEATLRGAWDAARRRLIDAPAPAGGRKL